MNFIDHPTKESPTNSKNSHRPDSKQFSNEWRLMSDFILNQDNESFRKSCQSINKGLYIELKQMADWIKNIKEKSKHMRKHTNTTKFEKYGDTSTHYSQSSRFGVIKFRNIVKHVLSSHVKKVQNQHSERSQFLSSEGIPEVDEL